MNKYLGIKNSCLLYLVVIISLLLITTCLVNAENISIKDILDQYSKFKGEDLLISGEIKSLLFREVKTSFKKEIEINIYLFSDNSGEIYILTTKHFEEEDEAAFLVKTLIKSRERIKENQVMLYDRYVLMKLGYTLPTLSKKQLKELLKNMPKRGKWVLLIDVE